MSHLTKLLLKSITVQCTHYVEGGRWSAEEQYGITSDKGIRNAIFVYVCSKRTFSTFLTDLINSTVTLLLF